MLCRELNDRCLGLIVILVGKEAEEFEAIFDKTKHDVRVCEPYFYADDAINWRID